MLDEAPSLKARHLRSSARSFGTGSTAMSKKPAWYKAVKADAAKANIVADLLAIYSALKMTLT